MKYEVLDRIGKEAWSQDWKSVARMRLSYTVARDGNEEGNRNKELSI